MKIRIQKTKASNGCNALRNELEKRGHDVKYILTKNSNYVPRGDHLIINWGRKQDVLRQAINYNSAIASDKVACFNHLAEHAISAPDSTTSKQVAQEWTDEGSIVVCRTLAKASSGRGIVLAHTSEEVVDAPLYTRYVKKSDEYRLHVFDGQVIDLQRKARNTDVPDDHVNWQIRTHDNGFIYMREGVEVPEEVNQLAIQAVRACNLNFGAVDIIHNKHYDSWYVLEINTAPGLTGATVESYATAIENFGAHNGY